MEAIDLGSPAHFHGMFSTIIGTIINLVSFSLVDFISLLWSSVMALNLLTFEYDSIGVAAPLSCQHCLTKKYHCVQELRRRGVADTYVSNAIESVFGEEGISIKAYLDESAAEDGAPMWTPEGSQEAALLSAARRQYLLYGNNISREAKSRRLRGWLQRRGFSWDDVSRVVHHIESEGH